jgi:hypothetical protein
MPPTTPIARSKTAALARIVDSVGKGYVRWTSGTVAAAKAVRLANKFHRLYAVGATPAQRLTRKAHGLANVLLVLYWPADADVVDWLMLATAGDGLGQEALRLVTDKPRLTWLGYELLRHSARGKTSWTWRRPKEEMAEHYLMLELLRGWRNESRMDGFLACLARQPGFHGVRSQTWTLFQAAQRQGFQGELPGLYYVQKVSHGERLVLDPVNCPR